MRRTARWTTLLLIVGVTATASAAQEGTESEGIEMVVGRQYTTAFFQGKLDELYARFTPGFKDQMSMEQFRNALRTVGIDLGVEQDLMGERVQFGEEYKAYIRLVEFSKDPGPFEVVWLLREDQSIAGFRITRVKQQQ